MITAHGVTYATAEAATARWNELDAANKAPGVGPSDGRVTEMLLIEEAIAAHDAEQVRIAAKPAKPELGPLTTRYIIEAENDLAAIKRTGYDDGRWRYLKVTTPEGRTTAREYRTQKGFLTAYIREAKRGSDILIAE